MAQGFVPHLAGLIRVNAEAFQFGASGRAAGAELYSSVADEIQHCYRLGCADWMVVGLGEQTDAVADADVLGSCGYVAV